MEAGSSTTPRRALWAFAGDEVRGQLSFGKGAIVQLKPPSTRLPGWAWGTLGAKSGYCPLNYFAAPDAAPPPPKPLVAPTHKAPEPPLRTPVAAPETSVDRHAHELLQWVQGRVPRARDWTASWRSGQVLCELINSLRPGTLDLPAQFGETDEETVALALGTADAVLGIAPLLNPLEVCSPDASDPERLALYVEVSFARPSVADSLTGRSRSVPSSRSFWPVLILRSASGAAAISFTVSACACRPLRMCGATLSMLWGSTTRPSRSKAW